MDAKITKQRLSHLLSYDWLKIAAAILGGILAWMFIFTTTASQLLTSQQFGVFYYLGADITMQFHQDMRGSSIFSHEVLQISIGNKPAEGDEYIYQIIEARLTAKEADVVFVPDIEGDNLLQYRKEIDGEFFTATCLEDFLYRYTPHVYYLDGEDGYLNTMENYLNGYYNGNYETGTLNAEKVERDFRAYVARSKDKRYKNEESISLGVQGELKRIADYRQALIDFYSYLDKGYISLTEKTLYRYDENAIVEYTGIYSINLCPDARMESLKNDVHDTKNSALNMNLVLLRDDEVREGLEFESLLFVTQLVKKHCTT